ncbi:hypothetical protein PMIN06_011517 [Paraphaeosphaeria minitans]
MRDTVAMDSGSFSYSQHSEMQRLVHINVRPLFPDLRCIKNLTAVDYGCGPGDNWVCSKDALLSNTDVDVNYELYLNDGVRNNWTAVAETIREVGLAEKDERKGHIFMLPRNLYDQCMPAASVDICVAWTSFHYLENKPAYLQLPTTPGLRAEWNAEIRSQGRADLAKLLRIRAVETKLGGCFLCAIPTSIEQGSTKVHYSAFSFPIAELDRDDIRQVLEDVRDQWSPARPWHSFTVEHPAWASLQKSGRTEPDYDRYAEFMAGFFMAIISGMLLSAVRCADGMGTAPARATSIEEETFLHQFKARFKAAMLSEPLKRIPAKGSWWAISLERKAGSTHCEV